MADKNVIDIEAVRSKREYKKKPKREREKKSRKTLTVRERKQRNRKYAFIVAVILIFTATVGCSSYKIISLKAEKNKLEQEQEKLKSEKKNLEEEAKDTSSLEYIEEQARKMLHLVLPGEILYVLPDEEGKTDEN